MKRNQFFVLLMAFCWVMLMAGASLSAPAEPLKFSCSAQVYEAFGPEMIEAFTKKTGIPVNLTVENSGAAIKDVEKGYSDLAASIVRLYHRHEDYGFYETVFAKDPMVVFTNKNNAVDSLSKAEIQKIFSGQFTNWKNVGAADQPIVTIIPDRRTGAYQYFRSVFMEGMDIEYDFMAFNSNMVIEAAKRFPYVVSFITRAALADEPEIKALHVDKVSPDKPEYPYVEHFSFITKGKPAGSAKQFIEFVTQGDGKKMLQKKGVTLLTD